MKRTSVCLVFKMRRILGKLWITEQEGHIDNVILAAVTSEIKADMNIG